MFKKMFYELYHCFPDFFTQYIDCRRRRKYWSESGMIFVHVPKAAGTSISHALYGRSLGHFKASQIKKWCPQEFEKNFKFAFVRNPWARAVSAYRFAMQGYTDTAGMRRSKQYNVSDFLSFESFVYEWLADKDLANLDNVFQPQYLFVVDEDEKLMVDFLGKVESFSDDLNKVMVQTGKNFDILDLNRVGTEGSYAEFYTNQRLIDAVASLYSKDIELFGYNFQ